MILYMLLAYSISLLLCLLLVALSARGKIPFTDSFHRGPQTFHEKPTLRIGGAGLFVALLAVVLLAFARNEDYRWEMLLVFVSSLPVFLAGFLEDISGRLSAKKRLLFMLPGAILAFFFLKASIRRVDLPLDAILSVDVVSFAFTVFALVGMANAINIIDGFNGLASMVSIIIFLSLAYVSYKVGNYFLTTLCLSMVGALAGFFLLNYPAGLIFLGDGGAYMTGFIIGLTSVLLVARHEEVSAWFPLVACIYPVFEVLFSIYRRTFLKGKSPFMPDGLHLHTLIYKKLMRKLLGPGADRLLRNSSTSPFLWALSSLGVVPALLWWDNTPMLMLSALCFAVVYVYLYWKLLLGKFPLVKYNRL